jgi:hypothetical protein
LFEFWNLYYQNKFINEFEDFVLPKKENKVKSSDDDFEQLYNKNMNLVNLEMNEYQIPISSHDDNIDANH